MNLREGERLANADIEQVIGGVRCVRWNPERPDQETIGDSRVNNFGDLLGPLVVERILNGTVAEDGLAQQPRLLSVGSVMHFAQDGDVVWGAGINGKISLARIVPDNLDIRAVRGPRTRTLLRDMGFEVPEVYGDPALLLPELLPELSAAAQNKSRALSIVPNLNDLSALNGEASWVGDVVSPQSDLWSVLETLVQSEFVIGSSLHAVIVAEAFGIPARAIKSGSESSLKYLDYYEGTGRFGVELANDVEHAMEMGPVEPAIPDLAHLRASFPRDLWTGYRPHAVVSEPEERGEIGRALLVIAKDYIELDGSPEYMLLDLYRRSVQNPLAISAHVMSPENLVARIGLGKFILRSTANLAADALGATQDLRFAEQILSKDVEGLRRSSYLKLRGDQFEVTESFVSKQKASLHGFARLASADETVVRLRVALRSESGRIDARDEELQYSCGFADESQLDWTWSFDAAALSAVGEGAWQLEGEIQLLGKPSRTFLAVASGRMPRSKRWTSENRSWFADRTRSGEFVLHVVDLTRSGENASS